MRSIDFEDILHAVRAIEQLTDAKKIYVVGSASMLASSEINSLITGDIDIMILEENPRVNTIAPSIGECSRFENTFGFYVDEIPEGSIHLPEGWAQRCLCKEITDIYGATYTVCILSPIDLATVKIGSHRQRDREQVARLLNSHAVTADEIKENLHWNFCHTEEEYNRALKTLDGIMANEVKGRRVTWSADGRSRTEQSDYENHDDR